MSETSNRKWTDHNLWIFMSKIRKCFQTLSPRKIGEFAWNTPCICPRSVVRLCLDNCRNHETWSNFKVSFEESVQIRKYVPRHAVECQPRSTIANSCAFFPLHVITRRRKSSQQTPTRLEYWWHANSTIGNNSNWIISLLAHCICMPV